MAMTILNIVAMSRGLLLDIVAYEYVLKQCCHKCIETLSPCVGPYF